MTDSYGLMLRSHQDKMISNSTNCIFQFNKDGDKLIEEMKLKVVYTLPSGSSEDSGVTSSANRSFRQGTDDLSVSWLAL
jgi:hypothetical protein